MLWLFLACGDGDPPAAATAADSPTNSAVADVVGVAATGSDGDYTFDVSIQSEETGCDQFANWWEVLGTDGSLIYRRILLHSHPTEQPFTRDGGPVAVAADTTVVVRAHMHPGGYGGQLMRGSAAGGFETADDLPADFAAGVESAAPQPEGCAF